VTALKHGLSVVVRVAGLYVLATGLYLLARNVLDLLTGRWP
jgi:hypothetical protein